MSTSARARGTVSTASPFHVVVMGVSGTGKSTIATGLAARLGLLLAEGDDFHPAANVAKMSAGEPLSDADRGPWLDALAAWTADRHREEVSTVLTCSALRRRYRDRLRAAVPEVPTYFVHLVGSDEVLRQRMTDREHFMPASLLTSQLDTLEQLEPDEVGVVVDTDLPVTEVVAAAADWLRLRRG